MAALGRFLPVAYLSDHRQLPSAKRSADSTYRSFLVAFVMSRLVDLHRGLHWVNARSFAFVLYKDEVVRSYEP